MASIRENRKNGKVISYTFTACLGRDEQGKQIRRYTNWTPPKGIGPAKATKETERQAALWEQSLKAPVEQSAPAERTIDERTDDFVEFIEKTWFPLQVSGNNRKAKTVAFYDSNIKPIRAGRSDRSIRAKGGDRGTGNSRKANMYATAESTAVMVIIRNGSLRELFCIVVILTPL